MALGILLSHRVWHYMNRQYCTDIQTGHLNHERFVWSVRDGKGLTCLSQTVGDGEKLLTPLNSALKVLLGLHIFPRVPKKKLNFVDQCN